MDNLNELVEFSKKIPGGVVLYIVKPNGRASVLYYSDAVAGFFGMTREAMDKYINQMSDEFATHNALKNKILFEPENKTWTFSSEEETITTRFLSYNGETIWLKSDSRLVDSDENGNIFLSIITDVSKDTESFENIVNKSGNMTVIYSEEDNSVLYTSKKFNEYFEMNLKDTVCLSVFSLFGYSDFEDFEKYVLTYVKRSDPYRDSKREKYFHLNSSDVEWWGYKAKALTFNDVTQLIEENETYIRDHDNQFIALSASLDAVFSCHMDLTANKIFSYVNKDPRLSDSMEGGVASDVFSAVWEIIPLKEEKDKFINKFAISECLESFEQGEANIKYGHRYRDEFNNKRFCLTAMTMFRNPTNHHIEAYFFQKNRTNEHLAGKMNAQLIEKGYILAAAIDPEREMTYVLVRDDRYSAIPLKTDFSYSTFVEIISNLFMDREHNESFASKLALSQIRDTLMSSKDYDFTIAHDKNDSPNSMFKYRVQNFDKDNNLILLTIEDMTNELQNDNLVSGFNKMGFENNALKILENSDDNTDYALCLFDIKNFKVMNLLYGHEECDKLLKVVFDYLKNSYLKPTISARIGDDNFACLINEKNVNLDVLDDFLVIDDEKYFIYGPVQLKCGIYHIDRNKNISIQGMCARAKLAKYYLLKSNHAYVVFDEKMDEEYHSKNQMQKQIDKAFDDDEFQVYYQPIVDAEQENIVAIEALARWIQNDGTCLRPGQFIKTLEEMGRLDQLDKKISSKALNEMMDRVKDGKHVVPVSFNLSKMDFKGSGVMDMFIEILKQEKTANENIFIEITEKIYYELTDSARKMLQRMKELGAKMVIDDFGSGQSSFSMLMDFQFDYMKLDVDFVRMIGQGYKSNSIVIALIDMAHRMKLKVIAEGVETREQANFLKNYGCDFFQGYLFYKPMDSESLSVIFDNE